jgi:hypothetical protein
MGRILSYLRSGTILPMFRREDTEVTVVVKVLVPLTGVYDVITVDRDVHA